MNTYKLYLLLITIIFISFSCTVHTLSYDDPTETDKIIKPLYSLGIAPCYINGQLDFTTILYDMMKNDYKLKVMFTDVRMVRDQEDEDTDLVIKTDISLQDPNSSMAWWAAFLTIPTVSLYMWTGAPFYVTDATVSMKIAFYRNGKLIKNYAYTDKVSQYTNFYQGQSGIRYHPILRGILFKWINDIESMKIYGYSEWGSH